MHDQGLSTPQVLSMENMRRNQHTHTNIHHHNTLTISVHKVSKHPCSEPNPGIAITTNNTMTNPSKWYPPSRMSSKTCKKKAKQRNAKFEKLEMAISSYEIKMMELKKEMAKLQGTKVVEVFG